MTHLSNRFDSSWESTKNESINRSRYYTGGGWTDGHPSAHGAEGRWQGTARPHRMPCGAPEPPLAQLPPGGGRIEDLPGAGGLHPTRLVSSQGRARQGGADLELRCSPRLRAARGGTGPSLAPRARLRAHPAAGGALRRTLVPWRPAGEFPGGEGARHRWPHLHHSATGGQGEDE